EPCGQLKVGSRVDYGWFFELLSGSFFDRNLVPGNAYYQDCKCPAIHGQIVRLSLILKFDFLDQKGI
ncbi:MAG: hypothetical protein KAS38_16105, partial [Anaerolineales bacterium]|nr:hypothetical protein [Anaerolineales bacterium]